MDIMKNIIENLLDTLMAKRYSAEATGKAVNLVLGARNPKEVATTIIDASNNNMPDKQ